MKKLLTLRMATVIWGVACLAIFCAAGCGGGGGGATGGSSGGFPAQVGSPVPPNGASNVPITQQLSWSASSGAISYDVYFGTEPQITQVNFVTNTANTSLLSTLYSLLSYSTTYYWRIDAKNSAGTTAGMVWNFSTQAPPLTPPAKVTLPNPANGVTDTAVTIQLAWGPAARATSYDVYFGTEPQITQINFALNTNQTIYNPGPPLVGGTLAPNTTYYWQVDSVNSAGTTFGDIWSFTTAPILLPAQVTTPVPANGAVDVITATMLVWNSASGATSYDIYFGTEPQITQINFMLNTTNTYYSPTTLTYSTAYYWRVDARNAGGVTAGIIWTFTTASGLPPQVTGPNPINGALDVIATTQLAWSGSTGTTSYDVYFGLTTAGWTPITNCTGTVYRIPATLTYNTVYYWRIDARNSVGVKMGNIWSFQTVYPYLQLAAGNSHTIALRISPDGQGRTLWAWGNNDYGQLGDSTTISRSVPTQIGAETDWKTIAAGSSHTVAIKSNGTLWVWGNNDYSQLGDSTTISKSIPTQIGADTDWTAIMAGTSHTLALKRDGTLWAWGNNDYGQLGDNSVIGKNVPTQIGSDTDWTAIAAGASHTLALKRDGTLWAWGRNNFGQLGDLSNTTRLAPKQIAAGMSWRAIAVGDNHSIAIRNDNTLWAWGGNYAGQLGNGNFSDISIPFQISADPVWLYADGGTGHTMALKNDGTIWTCGDSSYGQLGIGIFGGFRNTLNQVGTETSWVKVFAGAYSSYALKNDGTVWAWGNNDSGQLGLDDTSNRASPAQVGKVTIPPDMVTNGNPPDSSTDIAITARLSWTAVPRAASYDVYLGTAPNPPFVINTTLTGYVPNALAYSTTYYWRVDAKNIVGTTTGPNWTFSTLFPPDQATTSVPVNNASNVIINQQLSWAMAGRADSYDIYFGATNPPAYQDNITATSFSPEFLSFSTAYYWRVDSRNLAGITAGVLWTFTTKASAVPVQVSSPMPADGAFGLATNITLSWAVANNATSYDIYLGASTTPPFQTNITGTALPQYIPVSLTYNTVYYWRIDARNSAGTTSGNTWTFQTLFTPDRVANPDPANGAGNISVIHVLNWPPANRATSYDVYFGAISNPPFAASITTTTYSQGRLSYNITYYWRIDARNTAGITAGNVWNYTTVAADRPPVLTSPGNKSVNEGASLSIALSAYDPDGETVSYSASGLPSGATFDNTTGIFIWTPNYSQAGVYTVTFSATANGLFDTKTITITVINVDRPPVLTVPNSVTVNESQTVSFSVSGADPDGDPVTLSASGLPAGATFNPATGAFNWVTNFSSAGVYNVSFTATANGLTDTKSVTITVIDVLPPTVSTGGATNVTYNSAVLNGTVNPNGFATTIYFQYGLSTAYGSQSASFSDSGTTANSWSANLSGLSSNATYNFRIVATNLGGMSYGANQIFATLPPPPTVITDPATNIASNSATINGRVNPNGSQSSIYFQWGINSVTDNTSTTVSDSGTYTWPYWLSLGSLPANTTYYFRMVAANASGTFYGATLTFTTSP